MPGHISRWLLLTCIGALGSCFSAASLTRIGADAIAAAPTTPTTPRTFCNAWQDYLFDPLLPEATPVRTLRVNVHIMDSRDSAFNVRQEAGRRYVHALIDLANERLDSNDVNWQSPPGTPVYPKRYRYQLWPQPAPGDDGIYFHYDDDHWYFVSQGKNQNNYRTDVVGRYGLGTDSIMNIFIQVHPPDSMRSSNYRANLQGIALGTNLKMAGIFEHNEPTGAVQGLLNHEIGHILGLSHAWTEDGCPDTHNHPNKCWQRTEEPPCDREATNNMMDYNAHQFTLTPCQIARVHATMSNEKSPVRQRLHTDYCNYQPGTDIAIRDSVSWTGARDLTGNLYIREGGVLMVSCRLSMPEGGRIVVHPGGRLWLNGARIHNACGRPWEGIFLRASTKQPAGQVYYVQPAVIEDVAQP